jgi:hypothetical protein
MSDSTVDLAKDRKKSIPSVGCFTVADARVSNRDKRLPLK